MRGKNIIFLITLVCLLTTAVINREMIIEGTHHETINETLYGENAILDLDYDFIRNTTVNLSKFGHDNAKGREFGTDGEHDAAYYIEDTMKSPGGCNIDITNKYQIENIWYPLQHTLYADEKLASKLSMDYQYVQFNNLSNQSESFSLENTFSNPSTDNWDFFIYPRLSNNSSLAEFFGYA